MFLIINSFSQYKIDETLFYNATQYKQKHDQDVQRCRNLYFMEKYGLRAHSEIVYCVSSLEDRSFDFYDWLFLAVFLSIIGVLIFGSLLDCYINEDQTREHFERPISKHCKFFFNIGEIFYLIF